MDEITITLTREQYDELLSQLGIAAQAACQKMDNEAKQRVWTLYHQIKMAATIQQERRSA